MDYILEDSSQEREKVINEEYKLWKKNSPFLYDLVMTKALDWPSLTCQWLPDVEVRPEKNYQIQRMILGTHTNDEEPNYLQIAEAQLPIEGKELDTRKYEEFTNEIGGYGGYNDAHIKITQKIVHEGEINRARYQYDNPNIIATKSRTGDVYIFDRTTHESFPRENEPFRPDLILKGHDMEGYGLAWNPHKSYSNHLLSAGFDKKICQWDIAAASKEHRVLAPLRIYYGHESSVEDVAWHMGQDTLFASVGDDKKLMIWDTRSNKDTPVHHIHAHDAEVNCVEFNSGNEWILATGSGDKTAVLWDLRNMDHKLHTLKGHQQEIFQLSWSPHYETILATAGSDRRVMVWDTARIGDSDESMEGPPELLFMHGGHTNKISDFSWNPAEPWVIASTAEDNIVQVWQLASSIYGQDDTKEEEEDNRMIE
ncbi:WD40-repeat-containing domain protein [Halteromyces radiatus]|uniref:WD40-repeat-containing domain protein n=1 Tax=Halteromyces radiatus TaxID=101107 RepID=UPI0022206E53|nr:WD40-repeat-containing domain protein [Halteromyces radiatus]KAI8096544.1 WD40-repeat-containing domain protein [Halteromyces radiatus]